MDLGSASERDEASEQCSHCGLWYNEEYIEAHVEGCQQVFTGKPYPTSEKDQACDHCGFWFDICAIQSHEENCPVRQSNYLHFDGTKLVARRCGECGVWGGRHLAECSKSAVSDETLRDRPELENEAVF